MKTNISAGQLLAANENLRDPFFKGSVILVLSHTQDGGSIGINVAALPIADDQPFVYHIGGPVLEEVAPLLFYIDESSKYKLPGSSKWALSFVYFDEEGVLQPVDKINRSGQIYAGYAGWGSGQIDHEFDAGSWQLAHITLDELMDLPPEKRWQAAHESRQKESGSGASCNGETAE